LEAVENKPLTDRPVLDCHNSPAQPRAAAVQNSSFESAEIRSMLGKVCDFRVKTEKGPVHL
jgi:hypothetical protein